MRRRTSWLVIAAILLVGIMVGAYALRGRFVRRTGDESGAVVEELRRAAAQDTHTVRSNVELAESLHAAGHRSDAIDAYRRALSAAPRNTVVLSNLGILLADDGATGEALAVLRKSLEIDPRQVPARMRLVQLLVVADDFKAAESEARILTDTAPDDAVAWNLLGVALASQQRLDPARTAFARAVALDPNLKEARQNLAHIDEKLGTGRPAP
jgi:Flp pilus assembly protein TadD